MLPKNMRTPKYRRKYRSPIVAVEDFQWVCIGRYSERCSEKDPTKSGGMRED